MAEHGRAWHGQSDTTNPHQKTQPRHHSHYQHPSQRVLESDPYYIHLCQILQKSQLHAQPPDNFTLTFCHPRASIVSHSPRLPPIALCVPLWYECVANSHLKRRGSTAKRLSTHTPRLDFLHELTGANSWPAVRHSQPTKLSVTSEKGQGSRTTVGPRSLSAFGNLREISVTFLERTTRHGTTWHKLGAEQGTAGPLLLEQIDRREVHILEVN
jgi:hypothetical protein